VTASGPSPDTRAIVLDIEGTTTPISFVSQTLFPYARRHLRQYLEQHDDDAEWAALAERFRREHRADRQAGADVPPWMEGSERDSIAAYAGWLMDRDRKSPALKELQGRIWEEGYRRGELRGAVFPDVAAAFERWTRAGRTLAIFSSGSVLAQQWLFRSTPDGDLTVFLRSYFDTAVGSKADAASYARIAETMRLPAGAILFVSDVVPELDAAAAAGMRTTLSIRPGNAAQPRDHGHPTVSGFDEIP